MSEHQGEKLSATLYRVRTERVDRRHDSNLVQPAQASETIASQYFGEEFMFHETSSGCPNSQKTR
jgi:hypothetical protein